jgi:biotin carboxylase
MREKYILFLGGSKLGLNPIKWAKEIGFLAIVNDKNPNAEALKYADVEINFDSEDSLGISIWAIENSVRYNIVYCYCGSDFGLFTASTIHTILGIQAPSIRTIVTGLDKKLMRLAWKNKNIPMASIIEMPYDIDIVARVRSECELPFVIKPSGSSGSRGVTLVRNWLSLESAVDEANRYGNGSELIIEELIEGTHHDVNGLFINGEFCHCGIMDRYFIQSEFPVSYKGNYPSNLSEEIQTQLYSILRDASLLLGINSGPVKADFILRKGVPYLLEVSPRFHGDILTTRSMEFLGNLNPVFQFFEHLFDRTLTFTAFGAENGYGEWRAFFKEEEILEYNDFHIHRLRSRPSKEIKNNTDYLAIGWKCK